MPSAIEKGTSCCRPAPRPFPAASADDFLAFGRAIGISGASVTIPHKVALFDRVDEVYSVARRIGAPKSVRAVAQACAKLLAAT